LALNESTEWLSESKTSLLAGGSEPQYCGLPKSRKFIQGFQDVIRRGMVSKNGHGYVNPVCMKVNQFLISPVKIV